MKEQSIHTPATAGLRKVIAIAGPTASGKSSLALHLAEKLGGEIVSCDSMQIYRGMDIGTAKPSPSEQKRIPHHMIDIANPTQSYSCALFAEEAHAVIEDIQKRGALPILCGGTGLYMDNILFDTAFSPIGEDPDYRASLSEKTSEELFDLLQRLDPESAEKTHKNNRKRVIRALEILHISGKPKSLWDRQSRTKNSRYDGLRICLVGDRDYLYQRINHRVDAMMEEGLLSEVRRFLPLLSDPSSTAAQAIGYKEIAAYLNGECSLADAVEDLKKATRNYAKRQLTWLKREEDCDRFPKYFLDITGKSSDEILTQALIWILPFLAESQNENK